jgi:hypothetical protein
LEKVVVNIETRQNGKFEIGYPYNHSVDAYFKSLSEDFISNYGLTSTEVNRINDHKNATFHFDGELHEFVIKLSAFIKGFEIEGQVILDEYDELKQRYNDLKEKVDILAGESEYSQTEFEYASTNIDSMKTDLEKVNEMIIFYESQLIDETFVYSDNYIGDTEARLEVIDGIVEQNQNEETYYSDMVVAKADEYATSTIPLKEYGGYKEISLRNHYEAWLKRSETYYTELVNYFADEYNSYWTYGSSLMYGEKLSISEGKKSEADAVFELWKQTLIKKYDFMFEKALKTYSLAWLNDRATFEMLDFTSAVEQERKKLIELELPKIEALVTQKNQALRSVVSYEKERNYFKYMELIQLKREHIYKNIINGVIDQSLLDSYDSQIDDFEDDYNYVKTKMEQKTYWIYLYDLERHQSLLNEVKRWYDVVLMAITRNFQKELGSNEETYSKIDFYTNEQKDIERKIVELIRMKDKLEIDLNAARDELTLAESKMFEAKQLMTEKVIEYNNYFTSRIPFFTQNVEVTEKDGVSDLLDGKFYREFDEKCNILKSYTSNVVWWNDDDKQKLFQYYDSTLEKISKSIEQEWNREFGHEIMSGKKIEYFNYYIEKFSRLLYAEIHKFVMDNEYSDTIQEIVVNKTDILRVKFINLIDFAFVVGVDIEFNPDIFDYDDKFKFRISQGIETKENIIKTFDGFIENIKAYVYQKNLLFKVDDNEIENRDKIESIWNDMEKKYV